MHNIKLPTQILKILEKYDCFGFDTSEQALKAILSHDDWAHRWDCSEMYAEELVAIHNWRERVLGVFN